MSDHQVGRYKQVRPLLVDALTESVERYECA